ncbi:MAG TPA: thioredoxin domain-containing protein [Clostridia bacterium]|nr:thioredoxin domain-containing protein [Clostridia bacterium]
MNKKTSFLIVFLLLVAAFLAGSTAAKIKYFDKASQDAKPTVAPQAVGPTPPPFEPRKADKPEVKFFVMSFCPYGNQAEAGLEPVYQLLKDKVSWQPRYIVNDQKSSCEQSCPYRVYNDEAQKRCEEAIANGQVEDMDTCKGYFPYSSTEECLTKECSKLAAGKYESLHGEQELNQDVREICAYSQLTEGQNSVLGAEAEKGILDQWWKFVSLVNTNCSDKNADTCWTKQAQEAGLNTAQISSCSQTQAKTLMTNEITESEKYRASGSPTFYINDVLYQGGRAPEDLKKAICASFDNPPEECNQSLGQETGSASGGCGQ